MLQRDGQLEKISARYARLSPDPALAATQVEPLQHNRDELLANIDAVIAQHQDFAAKRKHYHGLLADADTRIRALTKDVDTASDSSDVAVGDKLNTLKVPLLLLISNNVYCVYSVVFV